MAGISERMAKRANEKAAHKPGITETNLRFCRMNVYIDGLRIEIDE